MEIIDHIDRAKTFLRDVNNLIRLISYLKTQIVQPRPIRLFFLVFHEPMNQTWAIFHYWPVIGQSMLGQEFNGPFREIPTSHI